jgi:hypothetical protein
MKDYSYLTCTKLKAQVEDDLKNIKDKLVTLVHIKEDEFKNEYSEEYVRKIENVLETIKNLRNIL